MTVATQLQSGQYITLKGNLYKITNLTHITPGKGNAIVQAEMRDVNSGVKTNTRFRSAEDVETVEVRTRRMQFLYEDSGVFHFMDQETYEQIEVQKDFLADSIYFIQPEQIYDIAMQEEKPLGIDLPARMTFQITETTPPEKGVQGKTKPATLETGLVVKVPLFLEEGERIVINTSSQEYVERAKD
ncbi:MAG: elongation factor P [Deltaproteobacteria bacterium]|nr:elongation factor P [Deltaproteobacteria bacterium]